MVRRSLVHGYFFTILAIAVCVVSACDSPLPLSKGPTLTDSGAHDVAVLYDSVVDDRHEETSLSCTPAAGLVNKLLNGDFESDFSAEGLAHSWYAWRPDDFEITFARDDNAQEGDAAQRVSCTTLGPAGNVNLRNSAPIAVVANHRYLIGLWMKGTVSKPVTVSLQNLSEEPWTVYISSTFTVSPQWQYFEFVGDAEQTFDNTRLIVHFTDTGDLTVDDVTVVQLSAPTIAGDIYLDAIAGDDDTNDGSKEHPWQSLSKLAQYDIAPCTNVHFKRGQRWHGDIRAYGGTPEKPVYYTAYGQGSRPIIDGAQRVTSWTRHDDNIVKANIDEPVLQLYVDGVRQTLARYPNSGYLNIEAPCVEESHDCLIESFPLSIEDGFWTDATIRIRTCPWQLESKIVTDSGGDSRSIHFETTSHAIQSGYGYYLENKRSLLDMPGEWFYDDVAQVLYFWPPAGVDIDKVLVETTVKQRGISLKSVRNVTIEGLELRNYGQAAFYVENSDSIVLRDNRITQCGHDGVYGRSVTNLLITGNDLVDVVYRGIVIAQSGSNITINKNRIRQVHIREAISLSSVTDSVISENNISDIGYSGMGLFRPEGVTVRKNRIDRVCMKLDDCGGIYVSGNSVSSNRIEQNIITNAIGNIDGKASTTTAAQGIYLDERANGVIVQDNIVQNTDFGLQIHNAHSNTARRNIFFEARKAAVSLSHNGSEKADRVVQNNFLEDGNVLHSLYAGTVYAAVKLDTRHFDAVYASNMLYSDSNYYAHPNIDFTFIIGYPGDEIHVIERLAMSEWQTQTGLDYNSVTFDGTTAILLFNDTQQPVTYALDDFSHQRLDGDSVGCSVTLDSFSGVVLLPTPTPCD